jgi:transposase-like protein
MRYSASEKLEIIELVEQSTLAVGRTLASIGIPRSTFYDWYSRYQDGGIEALEDGKPRPGRVWNKIPDEIGTAIVNLALEEPDLSPRELAVNFTDTKGSFVSEASVYRLLKDHGLITSPAFILMKAADHFANPTTAPNQLWQTDFTYLLSAGAGSICPPCSTTSRATFWPGSCAPPCRQRTCPIHCRSRCRRPVWTGSRLCIDHDC